jgi:hypothetical protein
MGAPSKRLRKVRTSDEFNAAILNAAIAAPTPSSSVYSWSLSDIMAARDSQILGQFSLPARLAVSMRTDDAIAVARSNRLAPLKCIRVQLVPSGKGRAATIANEADALYGQEGVGVRPETLSDIHGCLVDHGVAFAVNTWTVRADGSRVDCSVQYWPIEHVRWDSYKRSYVTRVDGEFEQVITHGDGRWIVFSGHDYEPHKQDAAILAGALVWARHAFALRDWSKGSVAHGSAKIIGEMKEGVPLQIADGSLSAEAAAFAGLLRDMATSDAPCGIRPAGSTTEFVTNNSSAWQVWTELTLNAEKAAARIYLGTDGTLGAAGGAPGVDVSALFGVATTKVQGDIAAIRRGLATGSIEIWTARNFGDSSLAPSREYLVPDQDADAARASRKERTDAALSEIERIKSLGFELSQEIVDRIAKSYDVDTWALPAADGAKSPTIALAPTDIARVVSVNEARASAGLGPLMTPEGAPDPKGLLTVEQFAAKVAAASQVPATPAQQEIA